MTHPDGTPDAERQPNPASAETTMAIPETGGAQPGGQYDWVHAQPQPAPQAQPVQPAPQAPPAPPAPQPVTMAMPLAESPTTPLPVPGAPTTAMPTTAMPATGTPTAAMPVSGQPSAAAEPPYSPEPPVSATPFAQSGPTWGQPYPTGPALTPPPPGAGAPKAKRGPLVPVLAALAAVLFLSTAALGVWAVVEHSANSRTRKTLDQRTSTLAAKSAEADRLRDELQRANDELNRTKTDLTGSKNQADELKRQKAVISKCFTLLGELGQAAEAGDRATVTKKQAEVQTACREADRYLE